MSDEKVEVVRKPLRVREPSSRTLDQQLLLRLPRLVARYGRLVGRLPPRSRLRHAVVWRKQDYLDHAEALEAVGLPE
jgi:hypothetical protein